MSNSKFANRRYQKEKKERKIVKTIMIEPSLFKRADDIHDNFSEFARDAIEHYLVKVESEIQYKQKELKND